MKNRKSRKSKLDPYIDEIKEMLEVGCTYQHIAEVMTDCMNGEIVSDSQVWQIANNRGLITQVVKDAKSRDLPHCDNCNQCLRIKSTTKATKYRICMELRQAIPQSCRTSPMECRKRK